MLLALDIAQWLRDDGLLAPRHRSKVPSPDSRSHARWHGLKVPSSRQQESRSKAEVKGWRDLNSHEAYERHGQEIAFTAQPITSRAVASQSKDSGDSCLP